MDKTDGVLRGLHARATSLAPREREQEVEPCSPNAHQPPGSLSRLGAEHGIAQMREPRQRLPGELIAQRTIYPEMVDSRVCNSFRHLRTTIFQKIGAPNFLLMVAAVTPRSGASFVARNLAAAIAFDKTKTALLIDCNLRKPTVDNLIINDRDLLGLTDYLCGDELNIERIIYPTGIPRLRAIPAGHKLDLVTECFTTPQLHTLLEDVRQRYPERCIVIDAPPMNEADARILSCLCDQVLLVIRYGRSTKAQILSAMSTVEPERLIGSVFNDVPEIMG